MQPWIKLARRLACETLCHWREFTRAEFETESERYQAAASEYGFMGPEMEAATGLEAPRLPYQRVRDARALAAKHVKSVALATRKPTAKQLREDLGFGSTWDFGLASWPKDQLTRAFEEYARRFVGTDYAPKFARNVLHTLKAS